MPTISPLKDLRQRMRLTKEALGKKLGLGASAIDKYESQLAPEQAGLCQKLAEQHGYPDLAAEFRRMQSGKEPPQKYTFVGYSEYEKQLIEMLIDIYRHPRPNVMEENIGRFLTELHESRQKVAVSP